MRLMANQRIGICGSHRTGKTTLSELISKEVGMSFIKTEVSAVFRQYDLQPSERMDFKTRLWIQHRINEAISKVWSGHKGSFVTDRTPLDFIAYTLADIQGGTHVDVNELESYIIQCFKACNQYFTSIIVIQPAIPIIYDEDKAALNRAYMEHLNIIIQGLCCDERLKCPSMVIKRNIVRLNERLVAAQDFLP